jgi:hypothetical protein
MTNVEMNHQKIRLSPENITEHEPIAVKRKQSDRNLSEEEGPLLIQKKQEKSSEEEE